MEVVTLRCRKCEKPIGTSVNAWVQIGKTYVGPVLTCGQDLDVAAAGSIRTGEPATLVDQCRLQDVACRLCEAVVGLRCLGTPVNHVLQENQLMLRLASVSICAPNSGTHVQPNIQRTLELKGPVEKRHTPNIYPQDFGESYHGKPASRDDTSAVHDGWSALRASMDAQERQLQMLANSGRQLMASFSEAVMRIDGDIQSLNSSFNAVRQELNNHSSQISGMAADLSSLKHITGENQQPIGDISDITELSKQLSSVESTLSIMWEDFDRRLGSALEGFSREIDDAKGEIIKIQKGLQNHKKQLKDDKSLSQRHTLTEQAYAEEVHLLRDEVAQLREATARDLARTQASQYCTLTREELDILVGSIAKFGNRTNQVETLQMESQLLKSRVQRLETNMALVVGISSENDGTKSMGLERKPCLGLEGQENSRNASVILPSKRSAPEGLAGPQ